jgi:hypothetical protein
MRRFDPSRSLARGPFLVVLAAACGGSSAGGGAPPDANPGTTAKLGSADASALPDGSNPLGPSGDASISADVASEGVVPPNSDDASSQFPGDAGADEPTDGAASCTLTFPAVTDFGSPGPFDVAIDCSAPASITADGTGCTVYRPTTMGQDGLKHPVIVWGNGTAAPPECNGDAHVFGEYDWLLNQWASQGFIVVAANTDSTGSGTDMLDCLNWMEQQNSVPGSSYEGVVDVGNYGSSGHSQGGASAINVGEDPRIHATEPFMPYTVGGGFSYDESAPTKQHGPMFLGSGGMDTVATPSTNQQPVFDASTVPTFWGTLLSADHVTFAGGSQTDWLAPATAWFRLFLMCDQSARPMFYGTDCTLCTDTKWTVQTKNL